MRVETSIVVLLLAAAAAAQLEDCDHSVNSEPTSAKNPKRNYSGETDRRDEPRHREHAHRNKQKKPWMDEQKIANATLRVDGNKTVLVQIVTGVNVTDAGVDQEIVTQFDNKVKSIDYAANITDAEPRSIIIPHTQRTPFTNKAPERKLDEEVATRGPPNDNVVWGVVDEEKNTTTKEQPYSNANVGNSTVVTAKEKAMNTSKVQIDLGDRAAFTADCPTGYFRALGKCVEEE